MNDDNLSQSITEQSFAIIDREMGSNHPFNPAEYAIARRVIHSTADFEFVQALRFSPGAIEGAIAALKNRVPIITDVRMVKQGIASQVARTFNNPLVCALEWASVALPGKTRTETGMLAVAREYPNGIFAIGNAPTALLALCSLIREKAISPSLAIGVPVGFVSVVESKAVLAETAVPQIRVEGRKGGSPVAAAIVNALLILAEEAG
ncbi:cobalt-precorrin-8X methylmutase [Lyngbya sp. CCY1209]|jgi:precorrin-8X/cobalt-precorrin-8 methylmutase|uniref:cobalt-precorrin-8X methylmutase n=1 Tax=Lyngbya sp. CCY1209 TaxID=2886103 RepID=UPI002D2129A1|nr:cobalt-precorrin-8X methylmutase [Lyngbya sp. CCY1209]MEB3883800.1 cobalt-precorrin-8X methylmutase [Lyngbya sp. CCY1209]